MFLLCDRLTVIFYDQNFISTSTEATEIIIAVIHNLYGTGIFAFRLGHCVCSNERSGVRIHPSFLQLFKFFFSIMLFKKQRQLNFCD